METDAAGTISGFDVDGPAGDLARYATAPSSAVNPTYSYYSAHGDLAAEANQAGVGTALHRYDPFGAPLVAPTGTGTAELFTGRWDKKQDVVTGFIEMGARPYEPTLGRFVTIDPVDGGSLNGYEYAGQDPINDYDLDGLLIPGCAKRPVRCAKNGGKKAKKMAANIVAPVTESLTQLSGSYAAAAAGHPGAVRSVLHSPSVGSPLRCDWRRVAVGGLGGVSSAVVAEVGTVLFFGALPELAVAKGFVSAVTTTHLALGAGMAGGGAYGVFWSGAYAGSACGG